MSYNEKEYFPRKFQEMSAEKRLWYVLRQDAEERQGAVKVTDDDAVFDVLSLIAAATGTPILSLADVRQGKTILDNKTLVGSLEDTTKSPLDVSVRSFSQPLNRSATRIADANQLQKTHAKLDVNSAAAVIAHALTMGLVIRDEADDMDDEIHDASTDGTANVNPGRKRFNKCHAYQFFSSKRSNSRPLDLANTYGKSHMDDVSRAVYNVVECLFSALLYVAHGISISFSCS